jgi:hypothetical protein
MTKPPCLRCRKPLRTAPTTAARIYLCPLCVEALGGEKKAARKLRHEWNRRTP